MVRIDPAKLSQMASRLEHSTGDLGKAQPLPPADAGPSSAAVSATVADLLRAAAGCVETAHRGAADLHANRGEYTSVDEGNRGMFEQLGR